EGKRPRRSAAAEGGGGKAGGHSVFVVEADERLQDHLREKLKHLGFRVFIAADPLRARDRFRQQPYDALIVDARTTGEDGLHPLEVVLKEAERPRVPLAAVLILSDEQEGWKEKVEPHPGLVFLGEKCTFRQLHHALEGSLRAAANGNAEDTAGE